MEYIRIIEEQNKEIQEQKELIAKQKDQLENIIKSLGNEITVLNKYGNVAELSDIIDDRIYVSGKNYKEAYKDMEVYDLNGNILSLEETATARALKGERVKNLNIKLIKGGKVKYIQNTGIPIFNKNKELECIIMISNDMTDYYKKKEILKSRNEFLNRLIDNFQLPVIRLSCPDLKILEINQKCFNIIKSFRSDIKSPVKIKGNIITNVIPTLKGSEFNETINRAIKDGEIKYMNNKTLYINGEESYWNFTFEPLFELNKEIQEIIVLATDITTEAKANKIMKKTLKNQEEFLANISHELKTPLNVIYSTIQLFNMYCNNGSLDQNKESIFRYINSMMQNCYRLSKLVNNIVDLSKIQAGFFELNLSNNNIVEIVEEIVMSVTDYTDIKCLNIIFDTDIEEKVIACDPEKIERIILNLISNAIKFSNKGDEILVSIEDKNEFIEISVKDSGVGIEYGQLDMIFDRFKQADKSLSRNAEGTGIGLSLVKSIVELHKGRIYVESEVGKGSKFTVVLPNIKMMQENMLLASKIGSKNERLQVELSDIC